MVDGSTLPLLSLNGVGNGIPVGVSVSTTSTGTGINVGTSMDVLDDDDDDSSIADSCGSCPQIITNDLKSLDEMVSDSVLFHAIFYYNHVFSFKKKYTV